MYSAGKTPRLTTTPIRTRTTSPIAMPGAAAVRFSPTFRVTIGSTPGMPGNPRRHVTGAGRSGVVISEPRGRDSLRHPLLTAPIFDNGSAGTPPSMGGAGGSSGGGRGSGPVKKRGFHYSVLRDVIAYNETGPVPAAVTSYIEQLRKLPIDELKKELATLREMFWRWVNVDAAEELTRAYRIAIRRIPPRQRVKEVREIIKMMEGREAVTVRAGVEFFEIASHGMGQKILKSAIEPMRRAIVVYQNMLNDLEGAINFHYNLLKRAKATKGEWTREAEGFRNAMNEQFASDNIPRFLEAYKRILKHVPKERLEIEAKAFLDWIVESPAHGGYSEGQRREMEGVFKDAFVHIVMKRMNAKNRADQILKLYDMMLEPGDLDKSQVGAAKTFAVLVPHLSALHIENGQRIMSMMPTDNFGMLEGPKREIGQVIRDKEER